MGAQPSRWLPDAGRRVRFVLEGCGGIVAVTQWPDAGVTLWAELERGSRFALLTGENTEEVAALLADLRGTTPLHVGGCLAESASRPPEAVVRSKLRGAAVLTGIEVLFDVALALEPVRLLAALAREHPPLVAVWPVATTVDQLAYPQGVRPGYDTASDLHGCLLLTTRLTTFADDCPFTTERFR